MQTLSKQLNALAKLCSSPDAIVNTWSASKLAVEVGTCAQKYAAEHQLKKLVTGIYFFLFMFIIMINISYK